MTTNRTSAALDESLITMLSFQAAGINTVEVQKVIAVCRRCKRMEEALEDITKATNYNEIHQLSATNPTASRVMTVKELAEEALAFDPLSE